MTERTCEQCGGSMDGKRSDALYCSDSCRAAAGKGRATDGQQSRTQTYLDVTPSGRTYYWAKDAAWYDRENVAELIVEHGALGVAVLDWLCCHAKVIDEDGWVKSGFVAIAKAIGELDHVPEVMKAVACAARCGCLDEYDDADGGAMTFRCRISGWRADQSKRNRIRTRGEERREEKNPFPISLSVAHKGESE